MRDDFPLYGFLVVGSSAGRTEAVHIILDVVEAELADLETKFELEGDTLTRVWIVGSGRASKPDIHTGMA